MADPFLAEIRIMSFNFPPRGWTLCLGGTLPINQNQALFSLLGTSFGGNGSSDFGLPDLRGRTPVCFGNGFTIGQTAGEESHTLTASELPAHTHALSGLAAAAALPGPVGAKLAQTAATDPIYAGASSLAALAPGALANAGGNQPHTNIQPYLTLSFCMALQGIFPSQN